MLAVVADGDQLRATIAAAAHGVACHPQLRVHSQVRARPRSERRAVGLGEDVRVGREDSPGEFALACCATIASVLTPLGNRSKVTVCRRRPAPLAARWRAMMMMTTMAGRDRPAGRGGGVGEDPGGARVGRRVPRLRRAARRAVAPRGRGDPPGRRAGRGRRAARRRRAVGALRGRSATASNARERLARAIARPKWRTNRACARRGGGFAMRGRN